MKISIESPHMEVPAELEGQIHAKLGRLANMYGRILNCEVILKKEESSTQKDYIAEAILTVPRNPLFARETSETIEGAIAGLADTLADQLRSYKEKLEDAR